MVTGDRGRERLAAAAVVEAAAAAAVAASTDDIGAGGVGRDACGRASGIAPYKRQT